MKREVVRIDESLCDGCGLCIPQCHEGALRVIDGKARLVSDLMCDGLGACLGHCPQGAISIEEREAELYDETVVMESMVTKGKNTVTAHLKHLKDHNETKYMKEGIKFLTLNEQKLDFNLKEVIHEMHGDVPPTAVLNGDFGNGCPGSRAMTFNRPEAAVEETSGVIGGSELQQWPVQMHLINPEAPCFHHADVLIAADCSAFAMGDFHHRYLKGKSLVIACPKLDSNQNIYVEKVMRMIDLACVNTITVLVMQVPCCRGLLRMVQSACNAARRKVPVKLVVVDVRGNVLQEEWTE